MFLSKFLGVYFSLLVVLKVMLWASLVAQIVRIHLECSRPGFDPWVGKIPWERAWQPSPVFWPGESPWTEEPGWPQTMGSQRIRHDCANRHTGNVIILVHMMENRLTCIYLLGASGIVHGFHLSF